MPLITPADLQEHIETDLSDTALTRVIEAEESEIVRRYGEHDTATEELRGLRRHVQLSRPAQSITSVSEDGDALTTDDYELHSGYLLVRAEQDFGQWVNVEYVPVDEVNQRTYVLIQLCKLNLAYSGYASQQGPEVGERALDYHSEREKLLGSLAPRGGLFV